MKKFVESCLLLFVVVLLFLFMTQRGKIMDSFTVLTSNMEESNTEKNRDIYVKKVWNALMNGESTLTLKYSGSYRNLENFVTSAVDDAFLLDDKTTTNDFDYLKYKYQGMHIDMRGFASYYTVKYNFTYLETAEQTAEVNKKMKEVFKKLNIQDKSVYDKIKLIHSYIIKTSDYDISANQNTAYDCLIKGKSACQGYAALTYKMMTEAGVPCRIISGTGQNEPHAWNIVKLDGLWYNIDCTWDDPVGAVEPGYVGYDYFLKSNYEFKDHIRDKEYNTEQFNQDHVMAGLSYGVK
jgi:Uncharacterized protein involved in cytokinesis, contains TGc (transglutaminase/protease-like) domain